MILNWIRDELQNVIQRKSFDSERALIQTVAHYHRGSQEASTLAKDNKHNKQEETKFVISFFL